MSKVNDLRAQRAKTWEQTKAWRRMWLYGLRRRRSDADGFDHDAGHGHQAGRWYQFPGHDLGSSHRRCQPCGNGCEG